MTARRRTPEGEVLSQVRDCLRRNGVFHWRVQQGLGAAPGVSDIIGIINGRLLAIEVKAKGKRVKRGSAQARFLDNVHEQGGIAIACDSIDAMLDQFEMYEIKLKIPF